MRLTTLALGLLLFLMLQGGAAAFEQSEESCYSYCAAWRLYWSDNMMWKYFEEECVMDKEDTAKTLLKFAKATATQGIFLDPVIQAWFCAEWIKQGIVPELRYCRRACNYSIYNYAPNLVGRECGSYGSQAAVYLKDQEKIRISVCDDGYGYAQDVEVEVYVGHTKNRDCEITNWQKLKTYTISELSPHGSLRNDQGIPFEDIREIDWAMTEDECNKIKVIVDPQNQIPEMAEGRGSGTPEYMTVIDDLPELPRYQVKDLAYTYVGNRTESVWITFKLENIGEEPGIPEVTVSDCATGELYLSEARNVAGGEEKTYTVEVLELADSAMQGRCFEIRAEDDLDQVSRRLSVPVFTGSVSGRVFDMYGESVTDATLTLSNGMTARTDLDGRYLFSGLRWSGEYQVEASSPSHTESGHASFTLRFNGSRPGLDGLRAYDVDILLLDEPASLYIDCLQETYEYALASEAFDYRGSFTGSGLVEGIAPGDYTLLMSKPGYSSKAEKISFSAGERLEVACGLQPLQAYLSDSGIRFDHEMKQLWELDLDGANLYEAHISEDGATIFLVTSRPAEENTAKVLIYDAAGGKVGELPFQSSKGEIRTEVDSTYDGAKFILGNYLVAERSGLILYEREKDNFRGLISPDGSLVCDYKGMYSAGFEPITQRLLFGVDSDRQAKCPVWGTTGRSTVMALDGAIYANCPRGGGICCQGERVAELDGEGSMALDVSSDSSTILASTGKKLYYLGGLAWTKNLEGYVDRVSVSPAGGYAVALEPHGRTYYPYLFDSQGNDLLEGQNRNADFYDVKATGKGVYYVRYNGKVRFGVFGEEGEASKQTVEEESSAQEERYGIAASVLKALGEFASTVIDFIGGFFKGLFG